MLKTILSGTNTAKLALWAIEKAATKQYEVKPMLNVGLKAVVASIAGGILSAITLAVMIAGAGYGIYASGRLNFVETAILTIIVTLGSIAGLFAYAKAKYNQILASIEDSKARNCSLNPQNIMSDALEGFIKGWKKV